MLSHENRGTSLSKHNTQWTSNEVLFFENNEDNMKPTEVSVIFEWSSP